MITQQYTTLRYVIYFAIFIFHISILFLLYNYSTNISKDHLVEHLAQGSIGQELQYQTPEEKLEEPTVSFANDQSEQTESINEKTNQLSALDSLPIESSTPDKANRSEQLLSKPLIAEHEHIYHELPIAQKYEERKAIPIKINHIVSNEPKATSKNIIEDSQISTLDHSNNGRANSHSETSSLTETMQTKPTISPAAFFQTFKDSYYREQSLFGSPQAKKSLDDSSNIKNSDYTQESLVNERLGELKIADYIQKIKQAFHEAAKRTPGMYLNSGKELNTDLNINLEIQSQGTVKIAKFQTSGINEVDEYIKRFLLDIIVSPIPKRYKVAALPFSTKILINIDRNTRFYTLRCFF